LQREAHGAAVAGAFELHGLTLLVLVTFRSPLASANERAFVRTRISWGFSVLVSGRHVVYTTPQ
jgi:hypothetical protein